MTVPTPPRLTGRVGEDLQSAQEWMWSLYSSLVIEDDVTVLDLVADAPLLYTSSSRGIKIDNTGAEGDVLALVSGVWTAKTLSTGGDVNGPSSSTTNAISKFTDTTGNEISDTGITIDGSDNVSGIAAITISGSFNHTGSTLGFFGTSAVAQAAAYTQSYATADRTLASYTVDDESSAYTGIDNAQAGTVYAQLTDLNALRTAYENLRALNEDTTQMLNAMVDDLQAYGLLQ